MTRTYADGIEDAARVDSDLVERLRAIILQQELEVRPGRARLACPEDTVAQIAAAIRTLSPSPSGIEDAREADGEEDYQIGKRDGRSDAVQEIDLATGGDGEYRYCTDHDPERHCPDPEAMIARIVGRFSGARESLTKAAAAFREEIERERFFSAPPREALYRELAEMCESASSKIGGDHG